MLQETTVTKQWQALSCLVFCATTQLAQQWQRETCKEDLCLADFGTRCSDDDVELLSVMGAVLSSLCTRQFNSSRSQERSSHLENFARFEQSNGKSKDKFKHHLYSVNPAQLWIWLYYIQCWEWCSDEAWFMTVPLPKSEVNHWSELDRWKLKSHDFHPPHSVKES